MSITLILAIVAAVAGLVAYFAIKVASDRGKAIKKLEADLELLQRQFKNAQEVYVRSLEARRQLEKDLATLRAGTPADKLAASVNILQDVSRATAGKPAPGLADLTAAASHKP